jgi:hypothetical protein
MLLETALRQVVAKQSEESGARGLKELEEENLVLRKVMFIVLQTSRGSLCTIYLHRHRTTDRLTNYWQLAGTARNQQPKQP